jgi:hypothetical protein
MSAVASIVANDAQATPVAHTFVPLGPDKNGVWWFEDQSQSTPIGYWRISLSLVRTSPPGNGQSAASNRVNRVKIGFHAPTLESLGTSDSGITPPPTIAYVDRSSAEFILPERDTSQNRKDQRAILKNVLSNAMVIDMVENLVGVY